MEIKKVGVVGMGTMGSQIGIVCARGGFQTIMVDLSEAFVKKGFSAIRSFLNNQVNKGKMTNEEMDKILSLISTTTDLTKALSDVELTIEAVFEDIDVKKELFKKMDGNCQKETILGSNTST
jgi:3-hydroxybutyryl-CoA dehydrogenase